MNIPEGFFATLLLGHLLGDFVLQNKWMAMNKAASTWKCLVHCTVYTAAVTALTWPFIHSGTWSLLIFLSHFPIDRWSLADVWLRFINGRSLAEFLTKGKLGIPTEYDLENYHALRAGFTSVVYTLTDSTFHLLLMFYGYLLLQ